MLHWRSRQDYAEPLERPTVLELRVPQPSTATMALEGSSGSEASAGAYKGVKEALRKRFEPDNKREIYAAEFQARRRRQDESWGVLADDR